ncbi:MAG: hypothetical protein NZ805_08525 [Armatimonadetes bacterium]|nr:hypothetical protein [Armatimonadota bacterium]MDW8028738.1 hypothetical protein [Armatimonadota bacterium]
MRREIPTWLAAVIIVAVILVVIGTFVYLQRRQPPTTPAELIKNPPNPAFTARPNMPPMQQSPRPSTP